MDQRERWPRGWRGLVLLAIAGVMVANLITPAVAHVGSSLAHLHRHLDKRYQRIPTATQHYTISGATFVDADGANRSDPFVDGAGWCTQVGLGGVLYAPVHLPDGVSVTGVNVDYADDASGTEQNGTVFLVRFPLLNQGGTYEHMIQASLVNTGTPGAAAKATGIVATPGTLKVDKARYAYTIVGGMTLNPAVCNVEILYTAPKPFSG